MQLPEHAQKVFEGVLFDVYQWEQELFDGSTTTFEGLKRPDTVLVIPMKGDRFVLSREQQPLTRVRWNYVGGRKEQNEDILDTAKRELLEETGMQSSDWDLLRTYEPSGKIDWKIHLFVARDCVEVADQNLESGERIELHELEFDRFIEIVSSSDFWDRESSNEVFRIVHEDRLDAYRRELFGEK